jgi:hypothetical protein
VLYSVPSSACPEAGDRLDVFALGRRGYLVRQLVRGAGVDDRLVVLPAPLLDKEEPDHRLAGPGLTRSDFKKPSATPKTLSVS